MKHIANETLFKASTTLGRPASVSEGISYCEESLERGSLIQ